jgi:hypothetical protein
MTKDGSRFHSSVFKEDGQKEQHRPSLASLGLDPHC